ncbi:TetR/AcrR family transcriptional regulator [Paenibacillus caui]|uniref:TetR/AcrR family transcriptional regulator n=1 Tax=Paenibacillus caui TaxID=2873927 RepID=UPI001CAA3E9D|nr:TetR/AcrR family transcriptional regulator [Paenibacillus caui]
MAEKSADKKKLILQTAFQLFSTKGARATSMQEIAELCGISKGSLYLQFKSKEELELDVCSYCYKIFEDKFMQVDEDKDLSPKDRLRKQLAVLLSQVMELREYLIMQFLDFAGSGKMPTQPDSVRQNNIKLIKMVEVKLKQIYGPEITPYTGDLLLLIHGMLGSYIRLLLMPQLPLPFERIPDHLLGLLDSTAETYMRTAPAPLIPDDAVIRWMEQDAFSFPKTPRHPLLVIKQIKHELQQADIEAHLRDEANESLSILEEEMIEPKPRRAILQGMLHNLKPLQEQTDLKDSYEELEQMVTLHLLPERDR